MRLTRLKTKTIELGTCLALAVALAACTTEGNERPPEVETAQPDWTADSAPVVAPPAVPAPRQPTPAAQAQLPYLVSPPQQAAVAAEAHLAGLLSRDAAVLHPNEVGYYVDTQEARLIQLLKGTGVAATRQGDVLFLSFGGEDTFTSNDSRLSESARVRLEPVARVLEEYDRTRISIFGYTDDVGDADYNQQLSVRRARALARLLIDSGVAPERLFIVGFGEWNPVADNATEAGRARNRRIELRVEPLTRPEQPTEA